MSTRLHPWLVPGLILIALILPVVKAQTVTVDNSDADFSLLYGTWDSGEYGTPYGADYNWAMTTDFGGSPAAAEWRPDLPHAGVYYVSTYYVQGGNRADNAPFEVHHASGSTWVEINQQVNGETWVSLGAYYFDADGSDYVRLHNDAHVSVVIADAIRFEAETTTVTLTMEATPAGWGTTIPAAGSHTRYLNEIVPITAEPQPGYVFNHWTVSAGAPVANPTAAATTVAIDQEKTVTAVFVEQPVVEPEFRGFWADAFHQGFKSQSQINSLVARAVAGNYNAIVPEVLAYQDTGGGGHGAYWNSDIIPRASDIVGDFDPLAYLVAVAHANNIEVHPWLVTYRACTSWPPAGNPTLAAHPEWIMVLPEHIGGGPRDIGGKYELDPGSPDVQEYLLSIVRELVSNYEIDGIHWDYIRYTNSDAGYPAYNWYPRSGLARFKAITGYSGTPSPDYGPWEDFRRREITELIRRAYVEMATIDNPRQPLRHTAALITWGDAPADFEDTSSWHRFQNWRLWLDNGYLDAGIPMTYYDYDQYPSWYRNWVDQSLLWRYNRHIFTGPGIYLNDFADSVFEIQYALNAGADGICTYSYNGTSSGGTDWSWYTHVADEVFTEPAPPPPMPWRDPVTAAQATVYGRVTNGYTGEAIDNAIIEVNGFPLIETDGNGFYVLTELSCPAAGIAVPVGASATGYGLVTRPAVWIDRGHFTEANIALTFWLPGDYDVDADVDMADIDKFAPCMTGPDNGPPPRGCDLFDRESDSDVDVHDFAEIQTWFTGS